MHPPLVRRVLSLAPVALLLAALMGASNPLQAELPVKEHEIVELAPGVYGWVWKVPLQDPVDGNALFIINDDDVVVVDAGLFPSSGARMAAALRELTDKPVRYLVNTHWHDDHHGGNQVYRSLWPGVEIIAHPNTRTDAKELTHDARPGVLASYEERIATLQTWLERGTDDSGVELTPERRERAAFIIELLAFALSELGPIVPTLPDLTVTETLTLHRGERTIEIRFLGKGNTRGDVVVHLPKERIVATGDLVVYPVPFGIGSSYREWIDTLDALAALDVDTFFPGHGPPLRDRSYLEQVQDLLRALVAQVDAAVAEGLTLEETQEKVTLADWKAIFAGDDETAARAFDAFFVAPAVKRAYELATGTAPEAERL